MMGIAFLGMRDGNNLKCKKLKENKKLVFQQSIKATLSDAIIGRNVLYQ